MTTDTFEQFSEALADRLADAATFTVAIRTGATAVACYGAMMWW